MQLVQTPLICPRQSYSHVHVSNYPEQLFFVCQFQVIGRTDKCTALVEGEEFKAINIVTLNATYLFTDFEPLADESTFLVLTDTHEQTVREFSWSLSTIIAQLKLGGGDIATRLFSSFRVYHSANHCHHLV